jgi:hypothetical protein
MTLHLPACPDADRGGRSNSSEFGIHAIFDKSPGAAPSQGRIIPPPIDQPTAMIALRGLDWQRTFNSSNRRFRVVIARCVIEFYWTLRVSKPEAWSITFDG